jgi:hypothetical protein
MSHATWKPAIDIWRHLKCRQRMGRDRFREAAIERDRGRRHESERQGNLVASALDQFAASGVDPSVSGPTPKIVAVGGSALSAILAYRPPSGNDPIFRLHVPC